MESEKKESFKDRTELPEVEIPENNTSETQAPDSKMLKPTRSAIKTSDDNPVMVETLQTRKSEGRALSGARVMFQEPTSSHAVQKHKSGVAFAEISTMTEDRFREKAGDLTNVEEDFLRESMKKIDANFVTNIDRIPRMESDKGAQTSEVDSYEALKEIEVRTKRQLASQADFSRPSSGPLKDGEMVRRIERGSTRRSSVFLGYKIEGMLAQFSHVPRKRVYNQDESGSLLATSSESSFAASVNPIRLSDNVGVQSMLFDAPHTDCLPDLEAAAFTVVLQEALDFLGILEHVIPVAVDKRWDEGFKTIDELYGTPEEPRILFREDMGMLPLIPTVPQKLQRDRTYIYSVLKDTVKDIRCLRRYDRLEVEVDDIVRTLEGRHNLEINHEIWIGQVKQLQDLITSDRMQNEEAARNLLASTQQMNAEVDNATFVNNTNLRYIQRWENARLDQQKMRLELKEQELNDALEECTEMEQADQIISSELRTFLQENTRNLEDEVVFWTHKYNDEIELMQQKINHVKENIEKQKIELHDLGMLWDERQSFIDGYYEKKERLKNESDYKNAVNNAATIIQALWKGYMVRNRLGRYEKLWISLMKKKNKKTKKKKTAKNNKLVK